jgi:hypothetical protein
VNQMEVTKQLCLHAREDRANLVLWLKMRGHGGKPASTRPMQSAQ